MDIHAVAEVLGVTPRHIHRLVAERRIPYVKVGRFVRFDPAELSIWLDGQRVEVQGAAAAAHGSGNLGADRPGGPEAPNPHAHSVGVRLPQLPELFSGEEANVSECQRGAVRR
jgi:excisionase family DNA binding protein